ncbi:MAG: prepilin-type N-terminal cleavage/methylation domain-containing protein [bacterium]
MKQNERCGFTLIELLIVVAIIGILAAIAVPNFLNAQIRAKVAHCVADMRTVGNALETYRLDNNAYPPWTQNRVIGSDETHPNQIRFYRITTPIAYLNSIPRDPFVRDNGNPKVTYDFQNWGYAYDYVNNEAHAGWGHVWRLNGWGPDLRNSWAGAREFDSLQEGCPNGSPAFVYRPSNGLASYGDIVRVGAKDPNHPNWYCPIENGY